MAHKVKRVQTRSVLCIFCNKQQSDFQSYKFHLKTHTKERHYFCKYCPLELASLRAWKFHENRHERKTIKCRLCPDAFATLQELYSHFKVHVGEKPLKCDTCLKTFKTSAILKKHLKIHKDLKTYGCNQCAKKFRTNYKLKYHVEEVHKQVRKHKCTFCDKMFYQKSGLLSHLRIHTNEKPFKCNQCNKRFAYKHNLNGHVRKEHSDEPFQEMEIDCLFCELKFKTRYHERLHLYVHTGERPYFCRFCTKELARQDSMEKHEQLHSTIPVERKFKCSFCEKSFKHKVNLKTHMACVHTAKRLFKCNVCEKSFKTKYTLRNHRKVHIIGQYPCSQCGKRIKSLGSLQIHIRSVHEKNKPYECSLCPKKFAQRAQCTDHLKRHIKEKVCCKVCNKLFACQAGLTGHYRRFHKEVADEDMVKCSVCDKRYKFREQLQAHMATHTKKANECPICNKLFLHRSNFQQHLKIHTTEKSYKCKTCGKCLATSSNRKTRKIAPAEATKMAYLQSRVSSSRRPKTTHSTA